MSSGAVAVLASGLDSAALVVDMVNRYEEIHPLYVRHGLIWEMAELAHLRNFLNAVATPRIRPLQALELPVTDLYGNHWSMTGTDAPGVETSDDAVYLPGRNLMLLAKASVWCERHSVSTVALATLAANPFGDNTPEFFHAFGSATSLALGTSIDILRPFAHLSKTDIIRTHRTLPLALTFSCIRPVDSRHCGRCNKCGERRRAFQNAGVDDATEYAPL